VDVPSFQVRPGQTIELTEKGRNLLFVREALELSPEPPPYLYRNREEFQGTLVRYPERDEIPLPVPVEERLVVEFYS
jgi:small subunit ribosomal protein S4